VQSLQYTTHHVNLQNGDTQFTVNVYDCWFDRSVHILDAKGHILPIASIHQHRLKIGHVSPSVIISTPSKNWPVYLHRRLELGVNGTNDSEEKDVDACAERTRRETPLHQEHKRALNIFKSRRRARRREGESHEDIVGPLAERVHRFIEEQTYHETPIQHTNVLRFGQLVRIYTKDDGVLYTAPGSEQQAGEQELGKREAARRRKRRRQQDDSAGHNNGGDGNSDQIVVEFPTLPEQRMTSSAPAAAAAAAARGAADAGWKRTTTGGEGETTQKHNYDAGLLQIVDKQGNSPDLTASPVHNIARRNPQHPHVTHNVVVDTTATARSTRQTNTAGNIRQRLGLHYTSREKSRWISELEVSGAGDILSPATFINPVIESMLGQAIPKLMQLYEPFLKPVLSNEVAGELSGKANEGVKPNVPTFTMEDAAEKSSAYAELVESAATQTAAAKEEAEEEAKNKFAEGESLIFLLCRYIVVKVFISKADLKCGCFLCSLFSVFCSLFSVLCSLFSGFPFSQHKPPQKP
jgi:hypothetical protein